MRFTSSLLLFVALALPAAGQTVTRVGSVATLDVGAWNVEQFQASDPQMANVVATMEQAGVDVWALQEVTSSGVLDNLLSRLGDGWDGRISSSSNLRMAFVFRTDVISIRSVGPMFSGGQFNYEFAGRPPLVMDANVTIGDSTLQVLFVTIHMKCCSDGTSYDRRASASTAMKNRLDFLHADERIIVLGDFNDETENSITFGRDSPFANFVSDPEYDFLITDGVVGTFCGSSSSCRTGSTIDNILVSSELMADVVAGSADRFDELLTELPNYVNSTSDHLPVLARFEFASATRTADLPSRTPHLDHWPRPASDRLNLQMDEPGQVEVWDVMGRRVMSIEAPAGTSAWSLAPLPPGVYFLRATTGSAVSSSPLIISR